MTYCIHCATADHESADCWTNRRAQPEPGRDEVSLLAEIAEAVQAMRAYARANPIHHFGETPQDPNGVHAWLRRNDPAHAAQPEPAAPADEVAAVLRYCRDVQQEGTVNERVVAQTVARMLAKPPDAAPSVAPTAPESKWSEPELWAEVYRLRAAVKGPDGFDTWQDAATDERIRRVRAERALAAPSVAPEPPTREALAEIVRDHLTSTYHCTRVWTAWYIGTMTEDDFVPASESDMAEDIADAILAARPPRAPLPEPAASADPLAGMSEMNRTIAYSAASKLREIGYEWTGKEWAAPSVAPEPVAWRWKYKFRDIGETGAYEYHSHDFAVVAHLPKGEPLFAHPPRAPLTDAKWCADWLRNNYQHHLNIASLCEHMIEDAERAHGISAAAIGADGGRGKA